MTALWTNKDIAKATGGRTSGSWDVDGVCIDSRSVSVGDLFIALEGPKFDGHEFAIEALDKGATAALVSKQPTDGRHEVSDERLVFVDDTMKGLNDLATAARARMNGRVVAITGSVGKTTTKEALFLTLGRQGLCHATIGNLNNHWGAPLTLARMPVETDYAVIELGMNHAGEIEPLSRLTQPHVAVITAVEAVHLEFFDSVAGIADAKAEIFAGVGENGTAIIPGDNPYRDRLLKAADDAGIETIVSFGTEKKCSYRLIAWNVTDTGTRIAADINGRRIVYDIGLPGKHMALNSLAAIAAVDALGGDAERAAADLADMTPPPGRGARLTLKFGNGSAVLIDESYNASPASVAAMVASLGATRHSGRLILALGDMLELGDESPALHRDLAVPIAAAGVTTVYSAGPLMKHLHDALPDELRGVHRETSSELADDLLNAIRPGDVIAVKGSFGSKMSTVVNALQNLSSTDGDPSPSVVNGG